MSKKRCYVAGVHFKPTSLVQTKRGIQVKLGAKPDQSRAEYAAARPQRENPKDSSPCKRVARDPNRFSMSPVVARILELETDAKLSSLDQAYVEQTLINEENLELKKRLAETTERLSALEESVSNTLHKPRRAAREKDTMHPREVSTFFGVLGGKSGLETLFAVLNSDGALGQLNYFRGERENVVMENEEEN